MNTDVKSGMYRHGFAPLQTALANLLQSGYPQAMNRKLAVVTLVALAWISAAFCGEIDDAADSGDVVKVGAMLKSQPDLISSRNPRGNTPLFHARDIETAEVLLAYKPDVNATNFFGETALFRAISYGRASVAELLLAHGATVNLTTMESSPLCEAMMFCGKRTAPHLTELLLAHGAEVNFKSQNYGWTALHWAARNDLTDCVKLLLAHGADVNAKASNGETPLFEAPSLESAALLVASNANVNAKASNGETPLHNTGGKVAELLISHGANVNAKDNQNCTPLGNAASRGDTNMVESLLANHAEIDAKGHYGKTALGWAALAGRKNVVELLLAKHADVNVKDDEGRTPLYDVTIWGYAEVAELLLANKADVNAKNNQGQTPIDQAAARGHRDMVELLRQHGGHE
jgi:cytohesin